jgi:uncharacterized protein YjbK
MENWGKTSPIGKRTSLLSYNMYFYSYAMSNGEKAFRKLLKMTKIEIQTFSEKFLKFFDQN